MGSETDAAAPAFQARKSGASGRAAPRPKRARPAFAVPMRIPERHGPRSSAVRLTGVVLTASGISD